MKIYWDRDEALEAVGLREQAVWRAKAELVRRLNDLRQTTAWNDTRSSRSHGARSQLVVPSEPLVAATSGSARHERQGEAAFSIVATTQPPPGSQPRRSYQYARSTVEPETRYARSADVRVAYQVLGDGPRDLVLAPGFVSHLELAWEYPPYERFMRRLASFARVIVFDKRGSGLSDPVGAAATIEERIDDIRAVMDAAGSPRADVFGWSEGATMAAVFGASFPERVSALVLYGSFARGAQAEDYPWGVAPELAQLALQEDEEEWWGQGLSLWATAPNRFEDEALVRWWGRFERQSMSPTMARAVLRLNGKFDIRDVLPSIRVPTLVIHRTEDIIPVEGARWLAGQIPGARFVELAGDDHWPWITDPDEIVDEVEEFLTGERHEPEPDRVLATVLFTDIVGSTERAAELGDRRWRDLLEQHDGSSATNSSDTGVGR